MIVLQLNYGENSVYDFSYPGGDSALLKKLSAVVKGYALKLGDACPDLQKQLWVSDCYFDRPLKRLRLDSGLGALLPCAEPEVRMTAAVVQREICSAVRQWEVDQRKNVFRETDHVNDSFWEEREHLDYDAAKMHRNR